jgi:hypothetical protein
MHARSVRARLVACLALAGLALGACGGRFEQVAIPASLLRVDVPVGATRDVISKIRATDGVAHVAGLSIVEVRASVGAKTQPITLAVADASEVVPLATSLAAGATPTPANLRDGWLLLTAPERAQLGIGAGDALTLRQGKGSAHAFRVADLGTELAETGAAGVVSRDRVPWLETGRPTMLLIAVAPGADPNVTASALASTLGTQVNVAGKGPSFLTGRAASALFGSFSYVINGDGTIRQDPNWVGRYIVRAKVPILKWVTCHRMMIPQLRSALGEVQGAGLASRIDLDDFRESGGCYVARKMLWDPAKPVSMHAWGLAIDFNVSRNQYGARPTMDPRIVEIFERWGFAWGGRWRTPDGMHFELAALIRR